MGICVMQSDFGENRCDYPDPVVKVVPLYACTVWDRLRGMLFGRAWGEDECLVLLPCCDVHTWFMPWPIDVAFVDEEGVVMDVDYEVEPFCRLRCRGAYAVVERRSCDDPWLCRDDTVDWAIEVPARSRKRRARIHDR